MPRREGNPLGLVRGDVVRESGEIRVVARIDGRGVLTVAQDDLGACGVSFGGERVAVGELVVVERMRRLGREEGMSTGELLPLARSRGVVGCEAMTRIEMLDAMRRMR